MLKDEVKLVQEVLIAIRNDPRIIYSGKKGVHRVYGICTNVSMYLTHIFDVTIDEGASNFLRRFWYDWEYWTGDSSYPVPANRCNKDVLLAAKTYRKHSDMYDTCTEYGQLRWELIDHLIYKMELYLLEN